MWLRHDKIRLRMLYLHDIISSKICVQNGQIILADQSIHSWECNILMISNLFVNLHYRSREVFTFLFEYLWNFVHFDMRFRWAFYLFTLETKRPLIMPRFENILLKSAMISCFSSKQSSPSPQYTLGLKQYSQSSFSQVIHQTFKSHNYSDKHKYWEKFPFRWLDCNGYPMIPSIHLPEHIVQGSHAHRNSSGMAFSLDERLNFVEFTTFLCWP